MVDWIALGVAIFTFFSWLITTIFTFRPKGPEISFMDNDITVYPHWGSKIEQGSWHYRFDLVFINRGDRSSVIILDFVDSEDITHLGPIKNELLFPLEFPISRQIMPNECITIRIGGHRNSFRKKTIKSNLKVKLRTWEYKKVGSSFIPMKFLGWWKKFVPLIKIGREMKEISFEKDVILNLMQPRRSRQGLIQNKKQK